MDGRLLRKFFEALPRLSLGKTTPKSLGSACLRPVLHFWLCLAVSGFSQPCLSLSCSPLPYLVAFPAPTSVSPSDTGSPSNILILCLWLSPLQIGLVVVLVATVVAMSAVAQLWEDEWEVLLISLQVRGWDSCLPRTLKPWQYLLISYLIVFDGSISGNALGVGDCNVGRIAPNLCMQSLRSAL